MILREKFEILFFNQKTENSYSSNQHKVEILKIDANQKKLNFEWLGIQTSQLVFKLIKIIKSFYLKNNGTLFEYTRTIIEDFIKVLLKYAGIYFVDVGHQKL